MSGCSHFAHKQTRLKKNISLTHLTGLDENVVALDQERPGKVDHLLIPDGPLEDQTSSYWCMQVRIVGRGPVDAVLNLFEPVDHVDDPGRHLDESEVVVPQVDSQVEEGQKEDGHTLQEEPDRVVGRPSRRQEQNQGLEETLGKRKRNRYEQLLISSL